MTNRGVSGVIWKALSLSTGTVGALAEELGVSRETLHMWAAGSRNPSNENLAKLQAALLARGADLRSLADELPVLWEAAVDSDGDPVGEPKPHTGHGPVDTPITLVNTYGGFRYIADSPDAAREGARRWWELDQDVEPE